MKLTIKGHPERGNEVIEILEILGGYNANNHYGNHCDKVYYINENGYIDWDFIFRIEQYTKFIIFSLEEFLEKFPYKVGDKVQHNGATSCGSIFEVEEMRWEENTIKYTLCLFGCNYKRSTLPAEYLQPYKEETMETITIDDFKANTKEWLIDKLHGMIISNAIKTIGDIHDELHKPQYPKTYEECCEVLGKTKAYQSVSGYKTELLEDFQKLLICRDAYWKIAGDWKPDWENGLSKFCIAICENRIIKSDFASTNFTLAFPTAEMRDAFYENFKDLIEQCKELL